MKNIQRTIGWKGMKQRRRELRLKMTDAEKLIWDRLKKKQLHGLKFRSQHGIGPYVADFYHAPTMTVIEIDGSIHLKKEVADGDKIREEYLKDRGYRILRFTNSEVFDDLEKVLETLFSSILQYSTHTIDVQNINSPLKGVRG